MDDIDRTATSVSCLIDVFWDAKMTGMAREDQELAMYNILLKCVEIIRNTPKVAGNGITQKNIDSLQRFRKVVCEKIKYGQEIGEKHRIKFAQLYFEYFMLVNA